MRRAIITRNSYLSLYRRLGTRSVLLFLIFTTAALCLLIGRETSRAAFAQPSREVSAGLNLIVRDSMTGIAVSSEITLQSKSGLTTSATNSGGRGSYQLLSGRTDLKIRAVGYEDLQSHFEADSRLAKNVTVWVDPIEPANELRPEVINSKLRAGQALLHGHVLDSQTMQPVRGAHVYLECAGIEAQTNERGYFLLFAPAPKINPTEELPGSDSLIVYSDGFKFYRRAHVAIAEGATHFIIDLDRGEGLSGTDDTHKLMLSPEQLKDTQTEIPKRDNEARSDDGIQPESLIVPTSIRVGSSCPSKTTCTVFNVYSLDTYVKNGLDDEWISSWNAESLKAGAIAYRSYGVYHVYHPLSANYDICNTTSCQVNDPSDSATSTNNATNNTTGMIVTDSTGNNPFFAEYAAENNDSACADGFTGSPSANWSCLSDPVDAGQTFNGHGRGMCQWGTQRWAVNQGRDYVWIVNHYYNDNYHPLGARSAILTPTISGPCPGQAGFTVNDNGDASDIAPGDGVCRTAGAVCTLRAAIQEENALTACGLMDINLSTITGSINLAAALPDIDTDTNIKGPGANRLTVQRSTASGTPNFRIFTIDPGRVVSISGLTMSNGHLTGGESGGGLRNRGILTIANSTVSGNTVYTAAAAGGVFNEGTLTLLNTWVTGNFSDSGGGLLNRGALALMNSTVSDNTCMYGGGLYNNSSSTVTLTNSTISRNSAGNGIDGEGGGLFNQSGTVSLTNVTVGGNHASHGGGGIFNLNGLTSLRNTIVAENTVLSGGSSPDLSGAFNSQDNNLIGNLSGASITGTTAHNLLSQSAKLGPLTDNGGATPTQELLPDSLAIDAGNNCVTEADHCGDSNIQPLGTDQRGVPRRADGDNDGTSNVDVGAYERQNPEATPTPHPTPTPGFRFVEFSSPSYSVQEDCTFVNVTVNRIGESSAPVAVDYITADGTATASRDYITSVGTLSFASGESSKTIAVLINQDSYVEGNETFTLTLSNPANVSLGTAVATVTIVEDLTEPSTNPIDDTPTFVCQQYHDFLNRQADAPGQVFWTNEVTSCGANAACIEAKRVNTSGAFYLSIEFQQTGYLVERMYKTAYGAAIGASSLGGTLHTLLVPIIRLSEFLPDTQRIGRGVIVGQGDWQTALENNKAAFALEFMQRSRFTTAFPATMTPAQFVDALNGNAGNVLSAAERTMAINLFGGAGNTANVTARAQVLRQVAEDPDLVSAEFNRAFVLMQYFGYLRRDPNATPDSDYAGYEFWLTKLNQFNGNFLDAEMVKAFLSSIEYRQRFGP